MSNRGNKGFDFKRAIGLQDDGDKKGQASGSDTKSKRSARNRHFLPQSQNPESTRPSDQQAGSSSGESSRQPERLTTEQLERLNTRYQNLTTYQEKLKFGQELSGVAHIQLDFFQKEKDLEHFCNEGIISKETATESLKLMQSFETKSLEEKKLTADEYSRYFQLESNFANWQQESSGRSTVANICKIEENMILSEEKEHDIKKALDQLHQKDQKTQQGLDIYKQVLDRFSSSNWHSDMTDKTCSHE